MGTSGVPANQRARELVLQISQLTVELAKVLGEPVDNDVCPRGPHHITEHERGGKHMLCGASEDASSQATPERVSEQSKASGGPDDPIRTLRSFLSDGEAPCTCAGTVDGDPMCLYCTKKEDACAALESLSESEFAKGHAAGAEAMRAACWATVQKELQKLRLGPFAESAFKDAIEAAEP